MREAKGKGTGMVAHPDQLGPQLRAGNKTLGPAAKLPDSGGRVVVGPRVFWYGHSRGGQISSCPSLPEGYYGANSSSTTLEAALDPKLDSSSRQCARGHLNGAGLLFAP